MAVSRPFVLALLGAVLVIATFASMRSAGDRAQAERSAAAPTLTPKPGRSSVTDAPALRKAPPANAPRSKAAPSKPAPPKPAPPKAEPEGPAAKPTPTSGAKKPSAATAGVPSKVARALESEKTVVLFFRQPGADDDATESAVRSLRGKKRVALFSDGIAHLARYRLVVTGLGITQAPSVVIVGKSRKAVLIEGFVDKGSLTQQVLDAR